MSDLPQASADRDERYLLHYIDQRLDILLSHEDVGPEARTKLRHLLAHYAKSPHPFRACMRDNLKRFGPGRTEKICATIKDTLRGHHGWRAGRQGVGASMPDIDNETLELFEKIPSEAVDRLILEASGYGP